ncbi:thermonuclease family protein [Devosia sp.]|uniref:thermonuclease family protein n=1 Tax=Devosia sp. TaxID=1871048 RepID=UPI003A94D08C
MLATTKLKTAALALLASLPVSLAAACDGLTEGPAGTVVSISDGDTVLLDNDVAVRLIGMQAPKLPLGREGFEAWPMGTESKQALAALVDGKRVRVMHGGEQWDRHGRALGQLFVESPDAATPTVWVQHEMVAAGMARVYSFPDNRRCVAELLATESRARAMKLGIWADPYYSVRRADRPMQLAGRAGHYELVEGRLLSAEKVGGRVYLNFGRSFKEDFTAVIDGGALRLFDSLGLDPLRLEDALVRVRGWIDVHNGPRIDVTHPEQIEVLATR